MHDIEVGDFSRQRLTATEQELLDEKEIVEHLLPKETEESHQNLSICLRSGINAVC